MTLAELLILSETVLMPPIDIREFAKSVRIGHLPATHTFTPERLKDLLTRTGMSQADAAEALGTKAHTVNKWGLKRHSKHHREPSALQWEFLLLIAGDHPDFILLPRPAAPTALGE